MKLYNYDGRVFEFDTRPTYSDEYKSSSSCGVESIFDSIAPLEDASGALFRVLFGTEKSRKTRKNRVGVF